MNRRRFLAHSALAGCAGPLTVGRSLGAPSPGASAPASAAAGGSTQAFHRDFVSSHSGLEYFVLGNGHIQAVLQTAATPEAGTHAGLFLMSPQHFSRKASSFLYHPERGAENTRVFVTVDRRDFVPEFATSRVAWTFSDGVPTIRIEWAAGSVAVVEELTTPAGLPALVRTVRFRNTSTAPVMVAARALLYPNLMLFDGYAVDRTRRELSARGFHALHLTAAEATGGGDRHLQFDLGPVAPGAERTITLVWSIGDEPTRIASGGTPALHAASAAYWQRTARLEANDPLLAHLFNTAKSGLRAAVATNGKMDGGIWQHNLEWVRDQSMVAMAAAMCGLSDSRSGDPAPSLLERMLQRTFDPPNRAGLAPGSPLATERESLSDPDTGSVLPIIYGIVDPQGPVARATLDAMETLWNQRWSGGRYHVTSEPDSPGGWPFPSLFVARANLAAGNHERVWRVLRRLGEVQGGRGGAWWEFYGPRATPPLPPVGLVVWTWAEIVMLLVHGLIGVRPQPRELVLAPHLLAGLDRVRAELSIRGARTTIILQRAGGKPRAVIDGREIRGVGGVFRLPYATSACTIECHVR